MRRLLPFLLASLLSACATPPLRLSPRFTVGDARTYSMVARATTAVDVAGLARTDATVLRARSMIEVTAIEGDEVTVRLTLTPTAFTRAGRPVEQPAEQRAELVLGFDGAVRRISSIGGLSPTIAGQDIADLAPVIGVPLPSGRVRLGARLPRPSGPNVPPIYQGRVAGLRDVDGRDCAIISLGTRRPISRQREIEGQTVRLDGTESASSIIAFAFRDGYPVAITTDAEGTFTVAGAQGTVVITTHTTLTLVSARS